MFHKEGTKTILLGIIFNSCILSDYFIDTMWLKKLLKLVLFLILVIILQFSETQRVCYKMKTKY
jgi:phosphatidylserine decarboxylase